MESLSCTLHSKYHPTCMKYILTNILENRKFDGESARENMVLSDSRSQTLDSKKKSSILEENLLRNWDGPNLTPLNTSKLTADQMGLQEMERQLKSFDKVLF